MTVYYIEIDGHYHTIFLADEPWPRIDPLPNESYWMVPGTINPED